MKIALVGLPNDFLANQHSVPRIGLLYLGGVLSSRHDTSVFCLDNLSDCQKILAQDFDWIGLTATTREYPSAISFLNYFKREKSKSIIAIGGPHVNALPDEAIRNGFDCVVKGEAESIILDLVESQATGFFDAGFIKNLDTIPFPQRNLVDQWDWQANFTGLERQTKSTVILLSRGCPYACAFCGPHDQYRRRSNESIWQELNLLKADGYEDLVVIDDLPFVSQKQVRDFCKMTRDLNLSFRCNFRADFITRDIADCLAKSGCLRIQIGIETVTDDQLVQIDKKITAEQNIRAIEICREAGIATKALLIWGLPGDNKESADAIIKWVKKNRPTFIQISRFIALPESPIWKKEFHLQTIDYSHMDFFSFDRQDAINDPIYAWMRQECSQYTMVDTGLPKGGNHESR